MSNVDNQDKEALLAALNAYGQNFLESFGLTPQASTSNTKAEPKRKRRKLDHGDSDNSSNEDEDEWGGFGSASGSDLLSEDSEDDFSEDEDLSEGEDNEETIEDDEFTSEIINKKQPEMKAFMSSKISKVREDETTARPSKGSSTAEDDYEEERNNAQNDALLHKLVHTKLLSGSLNSELNMTPAQRRRALEGRVMELASSAKLGKGESIVRDTERKKNSKRVRLGLERKVDEQRQRTLEEAKNLGNYHQSIKHIFKDESKSQNGNKKRDRGLKLGVGKFSNGVLKLSKKDVEAVRGSKNPPQNGRKKGGRKRS